MASLRLRHCLSIPAVTVRGLRMPRLPPTGIISWSQLKQRHRSASSKDGAVLKEQKSGLLISDTCVQVNISPAIGHRM